MSDVKDKKEDLEIKEVWWRPALLMFGRLSGWVIAPVIVGSIIGIWLDKKNDSEPWALLICIGIAFIISMFGLIKNTIEEYRKVEKKIKEDKEKKTISKL